MISKQTTWRTFSASQRFQKRDRLGAPQKNWGRRRKSKTLRALADKFCFGIPDNEDEIQSAKQYVEVYALVIECMTGKQALEEVRLAGQKLREQK